jgi:murein DD-endopeptidase MepM/ murein hydrolase activator NlpD/SH3-like domain-containing protein
MQKLLILVVAVLLYSCNGTNPLQRVLDPPPYKKYVQSLKTAELDQTAMARAWVAAGEQVLEDSVIINLPFAESGYFKASEPEARSYRFDAKEGQVLTVNGAVVAKHDSKLFLDLFIWKDNDWLSLAHADSTLALTHEFEKDFSCMIRIQPELLIDAYYTLNISLTPVLINPVAGASNKSIGSFYGASRDGGKRTHEGVDIFAKKGTAVVAPTDGYVTRVGTSKLGGKVVWMQDRKRGHSYYFAHLDSQMVKPGVVIRKGDTAGTVGNTGNARYTPSHLHFGIYQSKSKDPINYIRTLEATVNALPWDTTFKEPAFKVTARTLNFRSGPGKKHKVTGTLVKDTYVKVIAQSSDWYRVALPNKKQGFVHKTLVAPIEKGKRLKLKSPVVLLSEIGTEAVPVAHLNSPVSVQVLAHFENHKFVKTREGVMGWLSI